MFAYYLDLALRSFKRSRGLTALMLLTIAIGVAACMTTLTIFHVLSRDPIPQKSDRLFNVQLDAGRMQNGFVPGGEPIYQLTRFDAEALLREARGKRQVMMSGGDAALTPADGRKQPFLANGRWATADFFAMFEVPFLYGHGWTAKDDDARARVAVISKALNDKLFAGGDSVGKQIRLDKTDFTVAGVIDEWRPTPRFYDMNTDRFGTLEDVFLPFSTSRDLEMSRSGSMNCWGDTSADATDLNAPCVWIQYWVQLNSAKQAAEYKDYLINYSNQQRSAGRFERPANVRLRDVMAWLDYNKVVPNDVVVQMWLAFGFLLVCLLNTVGLLLAKFLRRSGEIGVRRALGASRRAIFTQCLVEAGTVGLAGGLLGLGLALVGLWGVRQRPAEYAQLAHLDGGMLLLTFALAIGASLLAGLLPAWRAMRVPPALQLKSQ